MSVTTVIKCNGCQNTLNIESSVFCINCFNNLVDQVETLKTQLNSSIKEINRLKDIKDLGTTQDIRDLACIAEAFHNITRCPHCHRPTQDTYKCIFCDNPDEEPLTVELEYTEDE